MIASLQERTANEEVERADGHMKDGLTLAHPFPLASREMRDVRTVVNVAGVLVGGAEVVVIAGPCSVESREQLLETARSVKSAGASVLRGGAYKPRTSPYDFQGLGLEALRLLGEAREETGLPVVTEVLSTDDVDVVAEYADMLQVGARNMQNFALLRRLAAAPRRANVVVCRASLDTRRGRRTCVGMGRRGDGETKSKRTSSRVSYLPVSPSLYLPVSLPVAARSSALSMAAPAAPRTVL